MPRPLLKLSLLSTVPKVVKRIGKKFELMTTGDTN